MNNWFDVDKAGLAALMEARGKSFALFELISNAWDAGASTVKVTLAPIDGAPYCTLEVEDDSPEGWIDLSESFTMFAKSKRAGDATKRGRYGLGEKLALSICREATITSTSGTVQFGDSGRRRTGDKRERGTLFWAEIRMTRQEYEQTMDDLALMIPHATTVVNGEHIAGPKKFLAQFDTKLPTVIADAEGNLRPTSRIGRVFAYESYTGRGRICEMGIPVCEAEFPWVLDIRQKIPLNMERNSVTEAFRKALQVAAVNVLSDRLDEQDATSTWASEAIGDARISADALNKVITTRFGERAVIAVPGDPIANAQAEAQGATVIHGGALSGDAWANLRKHQTIPTTSQAFPTPKPTAQPVDPDAINKCPLCGQKIGG